MSYLSASLDGSLVWSGLGFRDFRAFLARICGFVLTRSEPLYQTSASWLYAFRVLKVAILVLRSEDFGGFIATWFFISILSTSDKGSPYHRHHYCHLRIQEKSLKTAIRKEAAAMNSDLFFAFAHQSHHATLNLSLFLLSIGLCSLSICCFLCTFLSQIIPKSAVRVLGGTRIESPLQKGVTREKTNDGILISGDDKYPKTNLAIIFSHERFGTLHIFLVRKLLQPLLSSFYLNINIPRSH